MIVYINDIMNNVDAIRNDVVVIDVIDVIDDIDDIDDIVDIVDNDIFIILLL